MFDINQKIPTFVAITVVVLVSLVVIVGVLKFKINTPEDVKSNFELKNKIKTGKVALKDSSFYEELQNKVDQGHQPWRLSPVQVAKNNGTKYGFSKQDDYRLESKLKEGGNNLAFVTVEHNNNKYVIQLIQFAKSESDGIWIIQKIKREIEGIPVEWKKCRGKFFRINYPREITPSGNCKINYVYSDPNYLLEFNSQDVSEGVTIEKWIKEIYSLDVVKELQREVKTKKGLFIDRIKKIQIGKDIPGYFIHSWSKEKEMGVCAYVAKAKGRIIKIKAMQNNLKYLDCLDNRTLNRIISSFRLLTKDDY